MFLCTLAFIKRRLEIQKVKHCQCIKENQNKSSRNFLHNPSIFKSPLAHVWTQFKDAKMQDCFEKKGFAGNRLFQGTANFGYLEAIKCHSEAKEWKCRPILTKIQSNLILCLLHFFWHFQGILLACGRRSYVSGKVGWSLTVLRWNKKQKKISENNLALQPLVFASCSFWPHCLPGCLSWNPDPNSVWRLSRQPLKAAYPFGAATVDCKIFL